MFLLHETVERKEIVLDEGTTDRSFGLQEGRTICKKIADRSKVSTGGYDIGMIKDSIAGVLDGLNMHILQIAEKDKSSVINKISVLLDDAFTEVSKIK